MAENKTAQKEEEITKIFQDVRGEVTTIKQEKTDIEGNLDKIKTDLKNIQLKELELRDLISEFANKEGRLNAKRLGVEKKLDSINSKLEKLSKIQKDLSEVWA
ncbi:MAG: hypothetical protein KAT91_01605 [Candidatus Aenigmarchaeota archaeon]|nr:hypothetical protein [Candidatus Aenigmarchaeota archaeon]